MGMMRLNYWKLGERLYKGILRDRKTRLGNYYISQTKNYAMLN